MDQLPCELLHYILWYIDQPSELFRISSVCSRWRFFIMDDEYFLNQWFSRSLKRSQQTFTFAFFCYINGCVQPSMLNIDQYSLPINLRSSKCDFLPWTDSGHSCDYEFLFEHCYPLSLFESSHSFSFWLFLPRHCELNIQIGNFNTNGLTIVLCTDGKYHFDKEKRVSIADRWIHVVLTKTDVKHNYQISIDGEHVSKLNQYYLYFSRMERDYSYINMALLIKSDNNTLETSRKARIADLRAFKRCLTHVEIRAIYQQQTSTSQVKVGTYINSNNI